MFTQRKTNSYDLVGTNARNSDCSFSSGMQQQYGENLINRMSLEKSDNYRNSNISGASNGAENNFYQMPQQNFLPPLYMR